MSAKDDVCFHFFFFQRQPSQVQQSLDDFAALSVFPAKLLSETS